jgi:tungstate transport system substrate-binding protein
MMHRRSLAVSLGLGLLAPSVLATRRKVLSDPLRLGVEQSLVEAGLATRLQMAFIRTTGLLVELMPSTSTEVLLTLERGDTHLSLTNTPDLEVALQSKGLAHQRTQVAQGDWLLVGPKSLRRKILIPSASTDMVSTLKAAAQASSRFVSPAQGSGEQVAEQALWHLAQVTPSAPWYTSTPAQGDALAVAASEGALTLVARGVWLAQARPTLEVLHTTPATFFAVHMMKSFRVHHRAAHLFMHWVGGPKGQRVVQSSPGWTARP